MKGILTIFICFIFSNGPLYSKTIFVGSSGDKAAYKIDIVHRTLDEIRIHFSLNRFDSEAIEIDGNSYSSNTIANSSHIESKSLPKLPKINLPIAIFHNNFKRLKVEKAVFERHSIAPPIPSKGAISRSKHLAQVPLTFSRAYLNPSKGQVFPTNAVTLSPVFQVRRQFGVNLRISPLVYDFDQGEMLVYTEFIISIAPRESKPQATPDANSREERSAIFQSIFSNVFSNWNKFQEIYDFSATNYIQREGVLLIAAKEHQGAILDNFLRDKQEHGFHTWLKILNPSQSKAKNVKQLIKRIYRRYRNLSYVVLVGDADQVPFFPGTIGNVLGREADPLYGIMDKNDRYPDLIVSRIPIGEARDLETIIRKGIIHRNRFESRGIERTLSIASDEGNPSDRDRANRLNETLSASQRTLDINSLYDPDLKAKQVSKIFNRGLDFVNYLGHGTEDRWATGKFATSDVLRLEENQTLPIIVSVACLNGRFAWTKKDSLAESWLKVGSATSPKGAIAMLASSTDQDWFIPTLGQQAITQSYARNQTTSIGQLFYEGLFAVLNEGGTSADQTFQSWHSFGDPTLPAMVKKLD